MKSHLIKMAIFAFVAWFTFLPYTQMLTFLTYSPTSEEKVLEQAPTIKLKQGVKMYIVESEQAGKERNVAAGTEVKLMGISQISGVKWSPRQINADRWYVIRLADGTTGTAAIPFIAEDSLLVDSMFLHSKKVPVYLSRAYIMRPISEVDSIIDSKAKADDGWFKKLSRKARKGHARAIRIVIKMQPDILSGGYALFPKCSWWSMFSLPSFMHSGILGAIFSFIMWLISVFVFWPVIFMLAKDVAILPFYCRKLGNKEAAGFAWIIFLALCVPIMLFGLNNFFAWLFFILALFALFPSTIQWEDYFRCEKCHCRNCDLETLGSKVTDYKVNKITTTWGDGDKQVEKETSYNEYIHYKATCPECGHTREFVDKESHFRSAITKNAKRSHSRWF